MTFLRALLVALFAVILLYTLVVVAREGVGLIPAFFNPLFALGWQGQFNLDFACYLIVSALWLAWRSGFSGQGIAVGALASVLGMVFFAPVVLILMARADGDLSKLLLGVHHTR